MNAPIRSPRIPMSDVDAQIDCETAIDTAVRQLIDEIMQAGWAPQVAFGALRDAVENQARAYAADPDPIDDPPEGRKPIPFPLAPF